MGTSDLLQRVGEGFRESLSSSLKSSNRDQIDGHSADDSPYRNNSSAKRALELR